MSEVPASIKKFCAECAALWSIVLWLIIFVSGVVNTGKVNGGHKESFFVGSFLVAFYGAVVCFMLGLVLYHALIKWRPKVQSDRRLLFHPAIFLAIFSLLVVTGFSFLPLKHAFRYEEAPTDEAMISNFRAHRSDFEELARMIVRTDHAAGEQLLMNRTGLKKPMAQEDPPGVEFEFWLPSAPMDRPIRKGYAYLLNPPKNLFKSLNNILDGHYEIFKGNYRRIEGNWYLVFRDSMS